MTAAGGRMGPPNQIGTAMMISFALHLVAMLAASVVVWRSQPIAWVAFTDITVIGDAPKGEGLGQRSVAAARPVGAPAAKAGGPAVANETPKAVELPTVKPGPTAEQLAAVRAAFPIGTAPAGAEAPVAGSAVPAVEGLGDDPGALGVPWGKSGVGGPLAQRGIKRQMLPEYPAWARERGITGRVELGVTVTPDGRVKEGIVLLKKSGYKDLDEAVMAAVRKWEFEPLPGVVKQEDQYGIIPFRFALK